MKFIASLFCLLLSIASLSAQTTPKGVWNTGRDNTLVEVKEVNGSYIGTLISSDNPKASIGKVLLKDVKPAGKEWTGKMFAPKKGEWYDASLQVKGDILEFTIGSGFRSKTLEWVRE